MRRSLNVKQEIGYPDIPDDEADEKEIEPALAISPGFKANTFEITEDMNIDEYNTDLSPSVNEFDGGDYDIVSVKLDLLPEDLPIVDIDHIILLAAYCGDLDRYSQFRWPNSCPKRSHACPSRGNQYLDLSESKVYRRLSS